MNDLSHDNRKPKWYLQLHEHLQALMGHYHPSAVAIAAIPQEHIHGEALLEFKKILFPFPENIPECVDMDMKGLVFFHRSGIVPHIVFVRRQIGPPALAPAMSMGWGNAETLREFVEVWDGSENAEGGRIGEVNIFIRLLSAQKLLRGAKAFVVVCFAHVHLRLIRGVEALSPCHSRRIIQENDAAT